MNKTASPALTLYSDSLLIYTLGCRSWWLKYLEPCHLCFRTWLSFWLLPSMKAGHLASPFPYILGYHLNLLTELYLLKDNFSLLRKWSSLCFPASKIMLCMYMSIYFWSLLFSSFKIDQTQNCCSTTTNWKWVTKKNHVCISNIEWPF